jgi:hypothetical protein
MPYVQRDDAGEIIAISMIETESSHEWVAEGNHDLAAFIHNMVLDKREMDGDVVRILSESDLAMIRVVEDVVYLLIEQNLLRFTDLPEAAQKKLMARRSLRESLNSLKLMGDDNGVI